MNVSHVVRGVRRVSWVVLLLLAVTCRGCWLPDRNLDHRISEDALVGTWRLTPSARALMERDGAIAEPAAAYTIALDADGTAQIDVLRSSAPHTRLLPRGRWTLEHDVASLGSPERANVLRLSGEQHDGGTYTEDWGLAVEDGTLRLWTFLGDPDAWEFVEYERTE